MLLCVLYCLIAGTCAVKRYSFADNTPHAHITYAVVERSSVDGCYIMKPLKQKQFVHGLCYLLQEIYGIENKNNEKSKVNIYSQLLLY